MKSAQPREAIVLCGGLGTRLQQVISDIPKPMAPVAGRPFLEYVLNYLSSQHLTHFILAVGHLRESIMDYFGTQFKGIPITYSIEESPLGTGGAIMKACDQLHGDESFVINGDTFFDIPLGALHHFHAEKNAALTLALKRMYQFDRYGTVEIDSDGKIVSFNEKKYLESGLINAGIYCLHKSVFTSALPSIFSFEKEILEKEVANGRIYGEEFNGYFIDIGIPDDFMKAQIELPGRGA